MSRHKLTVTAVLCLFTFGLLALAVSHSSGPYGFERPALNWLGRPSDVSDWADVAGCLAVPAITAALAVCAAIGVARRAFFRVVAYAALAGTAVLTSEHVVKPLVQRSFEGELTFPSGSVTAVCATALALWLALYPLLERPARFITLVIGVLWTLLMCLAVVGALWHTPVDALGSILLSVGIVGGGAVVFDITKRSSPTFAKCPVARRRE